MAEQNIVITGKIPQENRNAHLKRSHPNLDSGYSVPNKKNLRYIICKCNTVSAFK